MRSKRNSVQADMCQERSSIRRLTRSVESIFHIGCIQYICRKKANLHLVTSNEAEKKEPENIFNAGMNRNQSFYTMLQSSKKMGLYPGSFQNQKYDAETRSVSVGINEKTDMFADAYGNFEQVTFDASRKLDDRLSSRLEPYHMEALKPFVHRICPDSMQIGMMCRPERLRRTSIRG